MQTLTRKMQASDLPDMVPINDPFTIEAHLVLEVKEGLIHYSFAPVEPYEKQYPLEEVDHRAYAEDADKVVFLGYVDEEPAGQIRVSKHWNRYAYIEDIAVKAAYRDQGVGHALMLEAIQWAREGGYPGLMLETQNNNAAACRLYEKCGFQLGGFDRFLYRGIDPDTQEIALYWYLLFDEEKC